MHDKLIDQSINYLMFFKANAQPSHTPVSLEEPVCMDRFAELRLLADISEIVYITGSENANIK